MRKTLLLVACAGVLLGGVYWLGRAASSPAPAATASTTAPVRSASMPVVAIAPARNVTPPAMPVHRGDSSLAADLVDADPKVRRAAMHEAVRDPDVDTKLLLDASRDRDLEVAGTATLALGKAYAEGRIAASELVARAQDTSLEPKVRSVALNGLGVVPTPETAAFLADLLARGSTGERAAAATLLQNQELELAVPALIRAVDDADAHVRECAVDALRARSRGRDFGEDRAAWQSWWSSASGRR